MPPFSLEGITGYLDYLRSSKDDNITVREHLYNFYGTRWMQRKLWDMRKAQDASYDYAIKSLLRLATQDRQRVSATLLSEFMSISQVLDAPGRGCPDFLENDKNRSRYCRLCKADQCRPTKFIGLLQN
ncbi:hypothetical protein BGZ65_003393, partial [Modicella reniformis]